MVRKMADIPARTVLSAIEYKGSVVKTAERKVHTTTEATVH